MKWKTVNICDMCDSISATYSRGADMVVLINTSDVLDGKFLNREKVPNKDLKGQFKKTFKRDDILYSEIRPANKRFAYVDFDAIDYIASTKLMVLRAKPNVNPRFLYHILKSEDTLEKLQMLAESRSGTFPQITYSEMANMFVLLPDRETQDKIVAILSSLDDKIENNNRINRNLEAQAQALFKSWFVDFEPWGGTMPEDWREGTLGEIAEFKRGKGILGKDARPGNVPVVAGGMEPAYYHDTANTKAPVITISASGANAGYVRLYNEDIWASDCSWIDASSKNLLWVYCYLSINRHILRHAQTGAVQPHVKAKDVNAFEIIVPVQKVIEDFIEVVKPLFDQIANNQKESHRLATLRDTLLPKLMRGEIAL